MKKFETMCEGLLTEASKLAAVLYMNGSDQDVMLFKNLKDAQRVADYMNEIDDTSAAEAVITDIEKDADSAIEKLG